MFLPYMGMTSILKNGQTPFVQIFNILQKFEENWPRGFRGEVVQRCGMTDDGRMDVQMTNG